MKQIAKNQQVRDRMRAAFGADADVESLPVYEAVALNTLPLRKSSGLFKGARPTYATLSEAAHAINNESAPLQSMHNTEDLPQGRVFFAEVVGDELRALFTVSDPALQTAVDNGTIDQVSVGYMPRAVTCSSCGFDYLGATATIENLWSLTCEDGHVLGEDGVYANVDGVASFYELSLVGKGAAKGAKIVGPSESRLAGNEQYQRLAASAKGGFAGVQLTASPKETSNMDAAALLAEIKANANENADLRIQLAAAPKTEDFAALQARVSELEPEAAKASDLEAKLAEANGKIEEALVALRAEATKILVACKKPVDAVATMELAALITTIDEHRAQFAAIIPVGGKSKTSDHQPGEAAPRSNSAFRAR
jgi:hypothetical protein